MPAGVDAPPLDMTAKAHEKLCLLGAVCGSQKLVKACSGSKNAVSALQRLVKSGRF